MSAGGDWLTSRQDGVRLSIKVRPRAARSAVEGVEVEGERAHLVVKVAAPPEGGKANAATVKLLAKRCGVAPGALSLVSGAAGRRKVIDLRGDPETLTQRLRALAANG
jgi:uncharacterized protein (TIGR00251 family)